MTRPCIRPEELYFTCICLIYLVIATAYNFVVPAATQLQHNPDEPAHYAYVQMLASGHIPVFRANPREFEGYQPPLYYAICVVPYLALQSFGDRCCEHGVRFVSTLIGLLTILAAFLTMRVWFPSNVWLRLSVTAYIAFLPQFDNLSASVNNDTLTILLTTVCIWQMAKLCVIKSEDPSSDSIKMLIGIGLLTKVSSIVVVPSILFCILYRSPAGGSQLWLGLRNAAICLVASVITALPWLIRNKIVYGNFLASGVIHSFQKTNVTAAAMVYWKFKTPLAYLIGVSHWTFASWWGVFDAERLFWGNSFRQDQQEVLSPLPHIYDWVFILVLISIIGLMLRKGRKIMPYSAPQSTIFRATEIALVVNCVSFFLFNLTFYQPQARYLYPSIVPITLIFWLGWQGWTTNQSVLWSISGLILGGLIALNVYTIFFQMIPRFAGLS